MAKRKRQTIQWPKEKDRQYNGQKKTIDNTMAKRKRQTIIHVNYLFGVSEFAPILTCPRGVRGVHFVKLHVFTFGVPYCYVRWIKDKQYNGQKKKTDNTMAKRKRQTIQWPKEKDRQYNGQKKTEFAPILTCPRGVRGVHFVKLHVFTFGVPYCYVRYGFRVKTMFGSSLQKLKIEKHKPN
jgi:hypothetical protein